MASNLFTRDTMTGMILNPAAVRAYVSDVAKRNKTIVVVGGCFDILHVGHIRFLQEAKSHGDVLMVLLESDERIRKDKGPERPIHVQSDRARVLAALRMVDAVVCLPLFQTNDAYDALLFTIKPAIIATTKGDSGRHHKERQAKLLHSQVVDVIDYLPKYSTTQIIKTNNVHE